MLLQLLGAHFLLDFGWQGDYMARVKIRRHGAPEWMWALGGHGITHGAAVALITGSLALGVFESWLHTFIDFAKGEGWISYHWDQVAHLFCKACWFYAVVSYG